MIASLLQASRRTVIFTGAGMSTESGVPDFRSNQGLWWGKDPMALASIEAMRDNPQAFVEFYRGRIEALQSVTPHRGYGILTDWGRQGRVQSVITQNTDGLHEQAGNPGVIPIHGTIRSLHCVACRQVYPEQRYLTGQAECDCGGFIRPSVVLFGEMLDDRAMRAAESAARQAELFIVLGSSLVVSPANWLPRLAKEHDAHLVIVNQEPTPLDRLADHVIHGRKIGEVLQEAADELGARR
ncbi:NAD-dependent deacylase [Paenibacillus sp. 1P07SE]|uniref:NAD-dependent deacylase n=1 Tax=Paenibacillus sp. 1P07SE TaxID=3132209 RepID=UPI0039A6173E